jgi:hypothetical protein
VARSPISPARRSLAVALLVMLSHPKTSQACRSSGHQGNNQALAEEIHRQPSHRNATYTNRDAILAMIVKTNIFFGFESSRENLEQR